MNIELNKNQLNRFCFVFPLNVSIVNFTYKNTLQCKYAIFRSDDRRCSNVFGDKNEFNLRVWQSICEQHLFLLFLTAKSGSIFMNAVFLNGNA